MRGEGCRIGLLCLFPKRRAESVQEAQPARFVNHLAAFVPCQRAIFAYNRIVPTDAIQHANQHIEDENAEADKRETVAADLSGRVPPVFTPGSVSDEPSAYDEACNDEEALICIGIPYPANPIADADVA